MIEKIKIPKNIEINVLNNYLILKGKLGQLSIPLHSNIALKYDNNYIYVYSIDKAMSGTFVSNLKTNLKGVSQGFTVKLQLVGIGYRFLEATTVLKLKIGYSHKMICKIPENVAVKIIKPTLLSISGIDNQLIHHFADQIRALKAPEVYKGKGIRYLDEKINIKETKKK